MASFTGGVTHSTKLSVHSAVLCSTLAEGILAFNGEWSLFYETHQLSPHVEIGNIYLFSIRFSKIKSHSMKGLINRSDVNDNFFLQFYF